MEYKGASVLVVDDNPAMRRLIRAVISDLVGEIRECGDGAAAVLACAKHRPNWVLLDIRMPGMDGIAAARAIRECSPETQIAVVTSYPDAEFREAARAAGAAHYLLKDDLMRLRQLFERRGGRDDVTE